MLTVIPDAFYTSYYYCSHAFLTFSFKKKTIHAYYEQNLARKYSDIIITKVITQTLPSYKHTSYEKKKKNKMKQEVKRGKCTRVLEKKM